VHCVGLLSVQVEPQSEPLPGSYREGTAPFDRLMLLRMLRPDKVVPGIQVSKELAGMRCKHSI
jgi:hypothetical protein